MGTLLGNRIFLEIPKKEESKLIVDENTKESLEKEMIKKMSRLVVHSVGDTIQNIKKLKAFGFIGIRTWIIGFKC